MTRAAPSKTPAGEADPLALAEAAVTQRFREMARLTRALVIKEDEAEALRQEIAALEQSLAEAQAASHQAQAELVTTRQSTSWRVSAPVRLLGRVFGR